MSGGKPENVVIVPPMLSVMLVNANLPSFGESTKCQ